MNTTPNEPAFSVEMFATTDTVHRLAKVSEVGDFPDKGISFTESDFDAATADFSPVPMDYEHVDGPLDGHLGKLLRVWREGTALFGEFAVPSWLQSIFTEKQITPKVSLTWDRTAKRIVKCAWVVNPRIPDAVLMSAFSASTASDPGTSPPPIPAARKARTMDPIKVVFSKLAAFFTQEAAKEDGTTDEAKPPTTPAPVVASAPDPQIAAMSAQIADLKRQNIVTDSTAFAKQMLSEKRITPADYQPLISELVQAAMDDAAMPVQVGFSDGGEAKTGSRVDAKKAMVANKTPHVLLDEVGGGLPPGAAVLMPEQTNAEMSAKSQQEMDKSVEKLLCMSDLGKNAMARKGSK